MSKQRVMKKMSVVHNEVEVVYNLVFKNTFYSLECFKEGEKKEQEINYSYVEDITDDEGEAEFFFKLIIKGIVLPIHIKEIAQDYFGD